jgi:circadian clock protein KaiC
MFTSLIPATEPDHHEQDLASLVDSWILVQSVVGNGEHNRIIDVRKSRGMSHSNQIREFLLTPRDGELADAYVGPQGVLTGSARQAQEARGRSDAMARVDDLDQRRVILERRRESVEEQVAGMWRDFEGESEGANRLLRRDSIGAEVMVGQRAEQSRLRRADSEEAEHDEHLVVVRQ